MYKIYGKEKCPLCIQARVLLQLRREEFKYVDVEDNEEAKQLFEDNGWKTVPQIFKGEVHIGGFKELKESFFGL